MGARGIDAAAKGKLDADAAAKSSKYPSHWGSPPLRQTRDYVTSPGGYGMGSSTLATWIQGKLDADAARGIDAAAKGSKYPSHWGGPPLRQTRDYVTLPGGYGMGSSTLASLIQSKLDADAARGIDAAAK